MEQNKQGEPSEWVQWQVLVDRLIVERPKLNASSVPVLTSRYLTDAVEEGYIDRREQGRNAFYRVNASGNMFLISRRDQLDDVPRWQEAKVSMGLMSYAVAPVGSPLIIEDHDEKDTLSGGHLVDDFMSKIKEKNPGLRSLYLRFE